MGEPQFKIIHEGEHDAKWLEVRRVSGVGASESSVILGYSTYRSPLELYAEKIGATEPQPAGEAAEWGLALEDKILEGFQKRTGQRCEKWQKTLQSTVWPDLIATPDAVTWHPDMPGPGVLNVKLTRLAHRYKEETPLDVWCQLQHEMAVTGFEWGEVAALLQGVELVWQRHKRDEKFILESLVPACSEFMAAVRRQEPYLKRFDQSDPEKVKKALGAIWPEDTGAIITLPGELVEVYEEREKLAQYIKTLEADLKKIDNRFIVEMKDASYGTLPNRVRVSLKTTHVPAQTIERKAYSFRSLRFSEIKE